MARASVALFGFASLFVFRLSFVFLPFVCLPAAGGLNHKSTVLPCLIHSIHARLWLHPPRLLPFYTHTQSTTQPSNPNAPVPCFLLLGLVPLRGRCVRRRRSTDLAPRLRPGLLRRLLPLQQRRVLVVVHWSKEVGSKQNKKDEKNRPHHGPA